MGIVLVCLFVSLVLVLVIKPTAMNLTVGVTFVCAWPVKKRLSHLIRPNYLLGERLRKLDHMKGMNLPQINITPWCDIKLVPKKRYCATGSFRTTASMKFSCPSGRKSVLILS